jgi:hypothetical protein
MKDQHRVEQVWRVVTCPVTGKTWTEKIEPAGIVRMSKCPYCERRVSVWYQGAAKSTFTANGPEAVTS